MPRGLSATQKAQARLRNACIADFVELIVTPAVRVWSGLGTTFIDGKYWIGVGELGAIDGLESNVARRATNLTLSLNGLPGDAIAAAVIDETRGVQYQGTSVKIYKGFCNPANGAPYTAVGLVEVWSGFADVLAFRAGGTIGATLSCDHFSSRLSRANGLRMTSESHNARLGTTASTRDLFFEPQNRLMGRAKAAV